MEPLTGAQHAFAVKAFYKNGDSFVITRVNFEESSRFIAIVLFHQPMPSRPFCRDRREDLYAKSVKCWLQTA
jgi:hypothetical protein